MRSTLQSLGLSELSSASDILAAVTTFGEFLRLKVDHPTSHLHLQPLRSSLSLASPLLFCRCDLATPPITFCAALSQGKLPRKGEAWSFLEEDCLQSPLAFGEEETRFAALRAEAVYADADEEAAEEEEAVDFEGDSSCEEIEGPDGGAEEEEERLLDDEAEEGEAEDERRSQGFDEAVDEEPAELRGEGRSYEDGYRAALGRPYGLASFEDDMDAISEDTARRAEQVGAQREAEHEEAGASNDQGTEGHRVRRSRSCPAEAAAPSPSSTSATQPPTFWLNLSPSSQLAQLLLQGQRLQRQVVVQVSHWTSAAAVQAAPSLSSTCSLSFSLPCVQNALVLLFVVAAVVLITPVLMGRDKAE